MKTDLLHLKDFYPDLGSNGRDATLELFLPYNMSEMGWEHKKRPCLLICPGGGYAMCSQREGEPIAFHFLSRGFNAFILTYSVAPHRYPAQLQEVAAALELIHKNADAWNCDTHRIALMGFSAGAHLSAHYANCYTCPAVREAFPHSKPVQATLLCYPVITADPAWTHAASFEHLLGRFPTEEESISAFSCEKQVTSATPPAFLWHTSTDGSVPVMNSLLYASALTKNKIPFELHVYPSGGHGLSTADPQTCRLSDLKGGAANAHQWIAAAQQWLMKILNLEEVPNEKL